jgi:hypothetical protein
VKFLPPGIWDNPQPEEYEAYQEFVTMWFAVDSKISDSEPPLPVANTMIKALAYGYDEEMEGGVVVNGASYNTLYVFEVGSGGVAVGGASLNTLYASEIGSGGGIEVGESADVSMTFSNDMSGGVETGGSTTILKVSSIETSGGAIVEGSASIQATYNPAGCPKRGWLLDDNTDTVDVSDDDVLDLDGDFTISGWLKRSSGYDAPNYDSVFQLASGQGTVGVFLHGGKLDVNFSGTVMYPARADTAEFWENWHHFILSRSGTSVTSYLDGELLITKTSSEVITGNSMRWGQYAANTVRDGSYAEWAKWDRTLSSQERADLADRIYAPDELDSTGQGWYIKMDADDYSEEWASLTITNNGSIPDPSFFLPCDGLSIGGEADITLYDIAETSGGVVVNSTADETFHDVIETSGGIAVSGEADEKHISWQVYDETMEGGVVNDGGAVYDYTLTETANGGATGSGEAIANYTWTEVTENGVVTGGVAKITFNDYVATEGGALIGGLAINQVIVAHNVEGGTVVGGKAAAGKLYFAIVNDGAVVGGETGSMWIAWPRSSGGVSTSGEIFEDAIYNISMEGGITVQGGYQIMFNAMDGGIIVGGRVAILHPTEVGGGMKGGGHVPTGISSPTQGGAIVPLTATEEVFVPNPCPCKPTSRVLSLNELNFLDQRIFIGDLRDKTDRRGLIWDSLETLVRFQAIELPFDYYLTQMSSGITLDVMKDDVFYGTFSSEIHPEVQDLFDYVMVVTKDDRRLQHTMEAIWPIERCP